MCVLFMYVGSDDPCSDYSLVLATNRDEFYDRAALAMKPWADDATVIGGIDLQAEGTWLAMSPLRRKLGVLLNLPTAKKPGAKTRGQIVKDFVKSDISATEYVNSIRNYAADCNGFIFVAVELGSKVEVHSYSNATEKFDTWAGPYVAFGNSLPDTPLKKVENGKKMLEDICSVLNKVDRKDELIDSLVQFLKSDERHFPDPELEKNLHVGFSSIFMKGRTFGTRAHTIILVTKTGHVDAIEFSLQSPIDITNPIWIKNQYEYELPIYTLDIK